MAKKILNSNLINSINGDTQIKTGVDVAKTILKDIFDNKCIVTTNKNKTASQVTYTNSQDVFAQIDFPNPYDLPTKDDEYDKEEVRVALDNVATISAFVKDDTSQTVTFNHLSKTSRKTIISTILVRGFKSQNQVDMVAAKAILNRLIGTYPLKVSESSWESKIK